MIDRSSTICLTGVVRGSPDLDRFLESVAGVVHACVLVDASGGNFAAAALRRALPGLPGEVIRQTWRCYGAHRAEAFARGRALADYCLVLDPDEHLSPPLPASPPVLSGDAYRLELRVGGASRTPVRLVRSDRDWSFEGPVRECLSVAHGVESAAGLLPFGADAAVPTESGDARRDALMLESALLEDPGNVRTRLALGDLYAGIGDWELAARCYERCGLDGVPEGACWYILYARALASEALGRDLAEIVSKYYTAFERSPAKAEALYRIAAVNRRRLNTTIARDVAEQGRGMSLTDTDFYFERPVYEYLMEMEYARSSYELGDYEQAYRTLDALVESDAIPPERRSWLRRMRDLAGDQRRRPASTAGATPEPPASKAPAKSPSATPRGPRRKLTVGMATYDDFDGVYFSVMALRLYHPEVTDDTEILVVDTNPEGPCAQALKNLDNWVTGYRYVPDGSWQSTAARDLVFREAGGDYVLCMDSHVLLEPGALRRLIGFLDEHPDCRDLLQGPLVLDDLRHVHTHFEPRWREGMYGVWGTDERGTDAEAEPFEIVMQGLGLFGCRRDAWPGFNPRFRGFGGEEGYIQEKFRSSGRKTLCLPFLRWVHRFPRPMGTRYPNIWEDRIRNYLIGFNEVGLDTAPVRTHFREHVGEEITEKVYRRVEQEMDNPFFYFDAIFCINMDSEPQRWRDMTERFRRLDVAERVVRFPAVATPDNHHVGCALSHRRIVELAHRRGWRNVLVFEDDALFLDDTLACLKPNVEELIQLRWNLFYLGGHKWGRVFGKAPGCGHLEVSDGLTCTHAVAYSCELYDRILADVPGDEAALRQWLAGELGIDQYLRRIERAFITSPVLATQPFLLAQEAPELAGRFTI